jgi:hypothetical protein
MTLANDGAQNGHVRPKMRLESFAGALVAATASFVFLLAFFDHPANRKYWPIHVTGVVIPNLQEPYWMSVTFYGHEFRTLITTNQTTFECEQAFWHWMPQVMFVGFASILGWFAGRVVAYRLLRPRPRL